MKKQRDLGYTNVIYFYVGNDMSATRNSIIQIPGKSYTVDSADYKNWFSSLIKRIKTNE